MAQDLYKSLYRYRSMVTRGLASVYDGSEFWNHCSHKHHVLLLHR